MPKQESDEIIDSTMLVSPGDTIFLPLKGYPSEKDAIFLALIIAEYFGSTVSIFHHLDKSSKAEEYFVKQLNWVKEKAKSLNVQIKIINTDEKVTGKTDKILLKQIHELAPKLTIMMSRRKGIFQKLSGSIAEKVARKSPHSVLIVRSPIKDWTTYADHIDPKKIAVPIGPGAPYEVLATQIAIAIANAGKTDDASISLLHVVVVPETVPIHTQDDEFYLHEEKSFIKRAGRYSTMMLYPMNSRVIIGRDIGRSVSHFVNKENIDLLVMGMPYLPKKFFGLYGTDVNDIYQKSMCSIVMLFYKTS
ncbi:MAG: universal stress protein [Candidatus Thorarchaeota archaeon]